ncbi:MAG TPA: bifunctional 5,10-methylenetetrahydrofolate dehydrogenase/5,10-methenyltetrahydrofolate cyclohydrolase [Candidatus Acidoferrales bacterium]|nr:bifunctional 5,10-methylenetetrahydrofolate dehydrogenase/5,10-methenyltetrahydrofolate cyclohydrolase [Candidatus Acidoferrales bacterium]
MRLLHGRPVAERVNARTKERIAALAARGITPTLDVLRVGNDPAAGTYLARLTKQADHLGLTVNEVLLPPSEADIITHLGLRTKHAHGVLLLTPLPAPLEETRITEHIPPAKDVEGVHPESVGLLTLGRPRFIPSTAQAVLELLRFYEIPLDGTRAVVIGRSPVVGRPAATLLLHAHATVTLAHSRTADLASHTRDAQLIVVAVGKRAFLRGDMIAAGATVVDAGINVTPSGVAGDADESVAAVAGALSPVPGGIGAITTALLLRNVVTAAEEQR